jgi:serine/threonine protein kinase
MAECSICGCSTIDEAQRCEKCESLLLGRDLRCGLYTYGGTSRGQVLQMRYAIIRELSSDVTGVKYLAEDVEGKKDVIVWALPTVAGKDEEKIRSLSKLCNNLKGLTDEHILNLSGFYSEKNVRYAVTEYVDGRTLEEIIASEGPLNVEMVLEIFGPIARSLDIVHKQGFIHGDINPANILVSSKGVVKLANFAIGKAIKEMLAPLLPQEDIKPSFYIAPEQSENAICSAQSDIHSLAACIYQSLSEEPLSRLDQRQLKELKHKPRRLVRLSEKQNDVLCKSLSANPQHRHNSAVELLKELRDSIADVVVERAATEPELISYEKSLADFKQNAQDWNRKLEEAINKLMIDAEREKQKHAGILHQSQTQARQWAEQLRADYEGKTEQLKAKIEEAQAVLATAMGEANWNTDALAAEKTLQRNRELEEAINKLKADAEQEKQKHAEMLSETQAQVSEQAKRQQADYERKIEQLEARITESEAKLAAAVSESHRDAEALVSEKEKALQQSRELEEAINKLKADAEQERQILAEALSRAQTQASEQAKQQQADYERKIEQLEARITDSEAKLATAMGESHRNTEALVSEKEKALQQSRELEEAINKLKADAEQEKQKHAELLSKAQAQVSGQAEQQQVDYERKIEQLEARITESEAKLAAAMSEASRNIDALAAEKMLQQNRELEEAINKLKADAEQEKQKHAEMLSEAQAQVSEQAKQQQADYERKIEQLEARITESEAKLAAAVSESHSNAEALISEKEKALRRNGELKETINKLKADAEQEKQKHSELLSKTQAQVSEQAKQQRADYEREIKQLEARITESEAKLAAAVGESHRNAEALISEKKRALQQSIKYEETLEKVKAEAKQQQKKFAEQLNQQQRKRQTYAGAVEFIEEKTVNTSSRSKISIVAWILVSIVILGIVAYYLYIKVKPADLTGSKTANYIAGERQAKKDAESTAPRKTYSQLYREAVILEGDNQWEKALATYKKAMEINRNRRIEYKVRMCRYNLCLSQAIEAKNANDFNKAVELYGKALAYNENADVRRELEEFKKIIQSQTKVQEWLEPASDSE